MRCLCRTSPREPPLFAGSDGMVSVITDFLNDILRWALNGWTPKALMERKL